MKFQHILPLFALLFYSITAYFSNGYIHPDEHFQLIEFAEIINGSNTPASMPWEYHAQIRPTIQPIICYAIFQTCEFFSLSDPYSKAFVLRLLTGLLAIGIIYYFINSCKAFVSKKYWNIFLILSYFLWFLPFINVRFSSETWSGLIFLLAISIVIRNQTSYKTYFLIGVLFGLSFLFRFQIAFACVGLILWLMLVRRESFLKIGMVLLSGSSIILIGILIDTLFYGDWVITPLEYFKVNLIQGKAAEFGIKPWYDYFISVYHNAIPIIGVLIYISFVIVLLKKYNNILIWAIPPFLIGHLIIGHKELRFLFPLVNLIPLTLVMAFEILSIETWNRFSKITTYTLLLVVSMINIVALILASTMTAGSGATKITYEINKLHAKKLNIFYVNGWNPYNSWELKANFYKEPNATLIQVDSLTMSNISLYQTDVKNILVVHREDLHNPEVQKLISTLHLKETCKSAPEYMVPLLEKYFTYNTDHIYVLYCNE